MNSHTPGPWAESSQGGDAVNVIVTHDDEDRETPVAVVTQTGHAPETIAANRRLIAAAPDLLAALETLVTRTEHLFDEICHCGDGDEDEEPDPDTGEIVCEACAVLTRARDAIAKAEED